MIDDRSQRSPVTSLFTWFMSRGVGVFRVPFDSDTERTSFRDRALLFRFDDGAVLPWQ